MEGWIAVHRPDARPLAAGDTARGVLRAVRDGGQVLDMGNVEALPGAVRECPECRGTGVAKWPDTGLPALCDPCAGTGRVPDVPVSVASRAADPDRAPREARAARRRAALEDLADVARDLEALTDAVPAAAGDALVRAVDRIDAARRALARRREAGPAGRRE